MQSDVEDDADFLEYFSFAMDGAALAGVVIVSTTAISFDHVYCSYAPWLHVSPVCFTAVWTYMHDDVSKYAGEDLELALKEVQDNHMKKWEAINMLKYVLSSISYPWLIKSHGINLLLSLVGENHVEENSNQADFTSYAPRIFATLKVSVWHF